MDQFIDNLARELAKPTSRRGVIRLVGGAMLGSLVAAWKPAALEATYGCSYSCKASNGKKCCYTGHSPFCIPASKTCCGNGYCYGSYKCCGSGSSAHCEPSGNTCCGKDSCDNSKDETCCGNKYCCSKYQKCKNGCCVASRG